MSSHSTNGLINLQTISIFDISDVGSLWIFYLETSRRSNSVI